jgi:hypothetical protein
MNYPIIYVPARNCVVSSLNIRSRNDPEADAEFDALVGKAAYVLPNLIGVPVTREKDHYIIFAGGRRLARVHILIENGKLPEDFEVPVLVVPSTKDALALSLEESQNPPDEWEGYQNTTLKDGKTSPEVVLHFGQEIVTRPNETLGLLKEALQLFNDHPNFALRTDRRTTSYALASRIDAHLEALAAGSSHAAVAIARKRWATSFLRIDDDARVVEETEEGFWVLAAVMISRAAVGEVPDDLRARYERGIALLPQATRRVFLLHRVDGLDYTQIAAQLGISDAEVEHHITEALYQIGLAIQSN